MEIRMKLKMSYVVALSGLLLSIFGVLIGTCFFPNFIEKKIKKETALSNDSEAFKHWLQPPSLQFNAYIFNVTNPYEIFSGEKPIVNEIGPFVYTQRMVREIIDYHDDDDTIAYATRKIYTFNQQKSGILKENDKITLINPTLMGILLYVDKTIPTALPILNEAIPYMFPDRIPGTVFTKFTVKELLFSGVPINCSNRASDLVCRNFKLKRPITVSQLPNSPDFMFSFFKHKNNSLEGPYRIFRGRKTATDVGRIKMYKNGEKLEIWPLNSTCNIIQGTDSTIFHPFMTESETLYIFVPDVCRSMFANFKRVVKYGSIISYEYVGSTKNFVDNAKYPDNLCHCEYERESSNSAKPTFVCPKDGAIYLSKCYKSPVHFSQPHFYGADKDYTDFIIGLRPNGTKHQTYVQIEPQTGVPIKGFRRLQINMELRSLKDIDALKSSSSGLFPLLWVEEVFVLEDSEMHLLKQFYDLLTVLDIIVWLIVTIGFAMLTGAVTHSMCNSRALNECLHSKNQNIQDRPSNECSEQVEFSNKKNSEQS